MCKNLRTARSKDDGSILAKCKIKDIKKNTAKTLAIMAAYNNETKTNKARSDNECQFYYIGKTDKCPGNPPNE